MTTIEITSKDRLGMAESLAKFFQTRKEYQRSLSHPANRTNAKSLAFETYWMQQDDDTILGMFARLPEKIIRAAKVFDHLRQFVLENRTPTEGGKSES